MALIEIIRFIYRDFHRTRPNRIIALEFMAGIVFLTLALFSYTLHVQGSYIFLLMGLIFLVHAVGQKYRRNGILINSAVCLAVLLLIMLMYDAFFGA